MGLTTNPDTQIPNMAVSQPGDQTFESNMSEHIVVEMSPTQPQATASDLRVSSDRAAGGETLLDFNQEMETGKQLADQIPAEEAVPSEHGGAELIPRKKKKKKSKSQKAAKAGTGYEEYYVDAPLTPAEHETEKGLYHSSLPFTQRIETAIQRYVSKRNLDPFRKTLFDRYLVHGGIEGGPKMFSGGLDHQNIDEKDAEEIATLAATHFVASNKSDPESENFVVDFEGCLKSYFSYSVPIQNELESSERVHAIVNVFRNFFNYLLHHDVCPEYLGQLQKSKHLCDLAEKELWATSECSRALPGNYNKACSELFGGLFQGQHGSLSTWLDDEEIAGMQLDQGISPENARKTFRLGLIATATPEIFEDARRQLQAGTVRAVDVSNVSLEVSEIIHSTDEIRAVYSQTGHGLSPLGTLKARTWADPLAPPEDLTVDEEGEEGRTKADALHVADDQYEFGVEDEVLQHCFVGMKFVANVTKLNIGISYFDAVFGVYCSFFHIIANESMKEWRVPEGEGAWLPMRKTGGGASDDEDEDSERPV